jgi:hypothetical protein
LRDLAERGRRLPPYLCALYSLDAVRNPEASEVVASVLVEEMLHMTLAANLLNAVADAPFAGGGHIIAVNGLASALAALDEIVEQGEGAAHVEVWAGDYDDIHPDREQDYYRFQELKLGRLRDLAIARPGVQRQSADAEGRDRLYVPPQGPGPGADGDVDRGWDDDRRSGLRICPPQRKVGCRPGLDAHGRHLRITSQQPRQFGCGFTRPATCLAGRT